MGLKSIIPGTAASAKRGHKAYLHRKVRGHDVLLLVEWRDGKLTEVPADYHSDKDGWFIGPNNLAFATVGEGVDPVDYYGVPTVRCHAGIACPWSVTAALQSEFDEAGRFYYDEDGEVIEVEAQHVDSQPLADGEAAADGGTMTPAEAPEGAIRRYNIQPPSEAVGWAFGLDQMAQRAPNAVSPNMLRRAVEIGKDSVRDQGKWLRIFLYGAGLVVGILVVLALLYILIESLLGGGGGGGGSGGSGGGTVFSTLALMVGPSVRELRRRIAQEG